MSTAPKMIKATTGFQYLKPEQLLATGYTVVTSLRGNGKFPVPPVDLDGLEKSLGVERVHRGAVLRGPQRVVVVVVGGDGVGVGVHVGKGRLEGRRIGEQ